MKNIVCTVTAACILGACMGGGGSSRVPEVPPPTPEELAIQDYVRIASNANLLLSTDRINWVPGRTEPERVSVECKGLYCSVGYSQFLRANKVVSVDTQELMVLPDTDGISTAVEHYAGEFLDAHNHGGWMEYSFFVSRAAIFKSDIDPDQGVIQVFAVVTGNATLTNPEVEATWTGFVSARDDTAGIDRDSYVTGDASLSVSIGQQVLADVYLTGMANVTTGQSYTDVVYEDMLVTDGQFSRYHADDDRLSGVFYGPGHEEVGGVFEHPQGPLGAYGGKRD